MGDSVTVVWDENLRAYDFGPGHPLAPVRVQLAMRLARDLGVLSVPGVHVLSPVESATLEDIGRVHDADYIEAVRRASADPTQIDLARGLGTADDPVFAGMHEASMHVAGATLAATRVNGTMLADVSGEEVEAYMLANSLVKPNSAEPEAPIDQPCAHEMEEAPLAFKRQ